MLDNTIQAVAEGLPKKLPSFSRRALLGALAGVPTVALPAVVEVQVCNDPIGRTPEERCRFYAERLAEAMHDIQGGGFYVAHMHLDAGLVVVARRTPK